MNLRAWFDPKSNSDIRQSLIDRQVLGTWRLQPCHEVPGKKLFRHVEDLRLTDGSVLQLSATYDCTTATPTVTVSIRSDGTPLLITSVNGFGGLASTVATGKGGFLALQYWSDRDEQRE